MRPRAIFYTLSMLSLWIFWLPSATTAQQLATVTFQDGVNGYTGTRDAYISQDKPKTKFGLISSLRVDGDEPPGSNRDMETLLIWDISAIPAGSTVLSAEITLSITNSTRQSYQVYEVKRNWDESQVTWNAFASGASWQSPGARGAEDRGSVPLASISPSSTGSYTFPLNAEGVALVQKWVDSPDKNCCHCFWRSLLPGPGVRRRANSLEFLYRDVG